MSKQIQVNLAFNAETAKAKQQINDLVNSLNKISTKNSQIFDDKGLKDAASAAKDLTKHLEASVNVNTGKLDLNKFTQSLTQSKTSLTDLYNQLSKAGPEGQKAFSQLSSAIASSDSSVLNLNAKVKDLGQTLKNTIKWQLSSSLVHGFMGAMSQAIGYAKDLNSSLNDIRIVTGASVDEMARFAEQANKSAKALSSTTTEYTKASLIYYQQGLSDSEVKERTDVTIKMANVSRESAQVVSDQMTAVWNNFYDGSKSLEYYADVMTALGAATASSVDEIAGGLEKFAAIGDTIGLSYEYAASALATITSNTRQSEEVVGTALKTIFARIQGLNLGETLDDGTTLNKYSEALNKIGISIFDQVGEIKNMDSILDEMGDKWHTLSKDQQIALAQTVAGTRQYTQLIALMDNWNNGDSDSFQANLSTAYGAEGTLQKQQDIYAEGWEAAADRVKAAIEDIYDSLINDEAIVVLLNGLEKILSFTGALIDGFGGLKGILLLVAGIFTRQIANEVPEVLGKLKNNFDILTGKGQKNKIKTLEEVATLRKPGENGPKEGTGAYTRAMADSEQASQMAKLERIHSQLTDAQYNSAKAKIDEARASAELVANLQDEIAEKEKLFKQNKRNVKVENGDKKVSDRIKELDEEIGSTDEDKQAAEELYRSTRAKKQSDLTANEAEWMASYERRKAELETLQQMDGSQTINQAIQGQMDKLSELYGKWSSLNQVIDDYQAQIESFGAGVDTIKSAGGIKTEKGAQEFDELTNSMRNYLSMLGEIDGVNVNIDGFDEVIANIKKLENTEEAEKAIQNLILSFHEFANIQIVDGQITQIGEEAIDAEGRMQKLEHQIDEIRGALEGLTPEQFEKLAAAAAEAGIEIAGLQVALKQQQNSNQRYGTPTQNLPKMEFSTALTKVGAMGMDVMALFTELGAVLSTCFDSGATAGEKFIAVLSSLPAVTMTIADIIGGLSDMPEALDTLSDGFDKIKDFSVTGSALAGMFGKMGTAMQAVGSSGGMLGGIIAKLGGVFAGATTSVTAFWMSLGWITLAITAVVAAVLLAAKAFQAWKASTPEGKLEAAKKATESMADAAKEADQAYKDLLNTINSYENAANALDGLTEGTQEFTNKLLEANNYARELIDTYNLIPDDYFVNDQGLIEFKSGVFEGKQNKYQQQVEKTQLLYQSSQRYQNQQENAVAADDGRLQLYYDSGTSSAWTVQQFQDLYKGIFESAGSLEGFKAKGEEEGGYQKQRDILIKSLFGENASWDTLGETYQGMIDATLNSLDSFAEYEKTFQANATDNANRVKADIITSLSNEDAYQSSVYKNAIVEATEKDYDNALAEAKTRWDNEGEDAKNDAAIEKAFTEYLGEQNYIQEDGKVYIKDQDGSKGDEVTGLSNLSIEAQREILAGADAIESLSDKGLEMAQSFNEAAKTMNDNEKAMADALFNNNLGALSKEQIQQLKAIGDITPEDLFDPQTVAAIRNNPVLNAALEGWLADLEKSVAEWEPPSFDIEAWKKDYAAKMDILNDLETGDSISPEDYALLDEEYQQYFQVQVDGTAILIQKAEELRAAIESIETQELKDSIQSQQNIIDSADEKYSAATGVKNVDINLLNKRAQSMIDNTSAWAEGYGTSSQFTGIQGMMDAVGMTEKDLAIYTTAEEKIRAIGQAWLDLQNNLNNNQQVLANVATSLRDLETQLEDGIIDIEEYNNAFDLVIAKEAELNDLDYESILDFAEYLQETNEELKDNEQLCKKIALSYHRWDKGIKTISENFDDWVENIKDQNKNSLKYINTLSAMRNAYKDVFSEIDPEIIDQLGEAFLTNKDNLKLLEQGLAGNEQAWNDWESTVLQELNNINPAFADVSAEMKNQMNDLVIAAANLDFSGLTPGASIDDADFNAKLNAMVFNTAEAAQAMCDNLSSVGVDAEIEKHTQEVDGYTANTVQSGSFSFFDENSKQIGTVRFSGGATETKQPHTETFYTLKGATYNGKGVGAGGGGYRGNKGGGGGGSKQPKHAEKKSDSDKTRYHTLTNQLEDLKSEYDEIAEASDRAFGSKKLDLIDKQISATDNLINKQKEYVDALSKDVPVDKVVMDAYYDDVIGGPKMEFDENGNIANYDEIEAAMHAKYNEMADRYSDDSVEWQQFEKKYEQMEKYIENYEKYYDDLRDAEVEYQNLINQRIDLQLQKVQYKVELELAIPEDEIALIEYQLGRIDEDAFKSAESIELLTRQAESLYDQIQINKQGLNDALNLSLSAAEIVQVLAGDTSVLDGKVFTEKQIDAIKEYRDNLLDLNEKFDDIRESIEEQVMEVFDAWNEKLQEGTATLEHYSSILESYKNIVDIVGKDTLGLSNKFMEDLDKAAIDNSINEVLAAKDAYESMLETQKAAQEALEDARVRNDEESIQMWEENLRTINEESRSMQEELLSKWEDALDTIATMFESTVERVIEAFNESIYALGGLEGLSEEFSRQQEIADILVDDYKKIYELSKLNRDINKAIDDTELIGGKQKLKKLLQEINKLQEDGVEMSEYDLEYLQKTFDLRMAELELEEAQRAKNTVRLSKDNEGNWSYIYTQNTDAVDAAQQKYEDALYAMQDLSSNYINEMSEQLISTSQEMAEALAEIRIQDYASIDDYYAEVERVQQQYQDELAMQESELQKAIDNNKQLYDEDWTNYHAATGYKISDTKDFVTTFKDSMLGSMLDSESATANFTDILTEATETLTAGLMTGAMDYYIALEEAMNAAGTSTGDFATDTSKNIDQIVEKSKEGAKAVDQMALEMQDALGAVIDTVSTWQETYGTAMQNIIDVNLEVIKSFNDMLEALSVGGNTTVTVDYNIENSPESILNPSQFDTGGYTGTWGNTGKLAILHEKELVLEPKDTVNMLNALKISKSMLDTIELNAQQASRGIGYTTPTVVKEDNIQTLEQMVHITAEFPYATDHNEIQEAFKNLTNTASQYANRK